jgi:type I restriction enzyme R subunit
MGTVAPSSTACWIKKIGGYHQFHVTRRAMELTIPAAGPNSDRRAGIVWQTDGSGKGLTMAFYAGELVLHPAMIKPTIVVLTD